MGRVTAWLMKPGGRHFLREIAHVRTGFGTGTGIFSDGVSGGDPQRSREI